MRINESVKRQVESGLDIISIGEPAGIGSGTIFRVVVGFDAIKPQHRRRGAVVSLERVR